MGIIMLVLSKMMLVQVKVPIHNGILAPKCIQERLARVPSAQSVRYIVNEMYSMPKFLLKVQIDGKMHLRRFFRLNWQGPSHDKRIVILDAELAWLQ